MGSLLSKSVGSKSADVQPEFGIEPPKGQSPTRQHHDLLVQGRRSPEDSIFVLGRVDSEFKYQGLALKVREAPAATRRRPLLK